MKLIVAIVRPNRLEVLKQELQKGGIRGLTVTSVHGAGRQRGHTEIYRGHEYEVGLVSKVKVEMAVEDFEVQKIVDIILTTSRSGVDGKIGDGKVFIMPVEEVVRIRTGEVGASAV